MENKVINITERINKKKMEKSEISYELYLSEMYADQLGKDFKNILNENKMKINERMKK
ncbi:hypothetical protein [Bacillus sp. REN16]|uniref:hypothetical protein n=1 Tax=Bacillus sp. REN16 TaxID=2887296 RepID=UPI001E50FFE3|nr:hypothetical protein [Bacillus sp. REN16]MCC3359719.1 hypothetical protein [Bacillus sp. REN16]